MRKIFLFGFGILFLISCASIEQKEQMAKDAEKARAEEQRIVDCTKTIKIIEENKITKPYEIITVIRVTIPNYYNDDAFDYLKRQACEKGADALIYPEMESGSRNTSYSAKAIVWSK